MRSFQRLFVVVSITLSFGLVAPTATLAGEPPAVTAASATLAARAPAAGDRVRTNASTVLDVAITARMGRQGDKVSRVESTRAVTRIVEVTDDGRTLTVEYPSASYDRSTDGKTTSVPVPTVGRAYRVAPGDVPTVAGADGAALTDRERATVAAEAHQLAPIVVFPELAGRELEPGAVVTLPDAAVATLLPLDGELAVERSDAAYLGTASVDGATLAMFEIAIAADATTSNGTLHVDLAGQLGVDIETGWLGQVTLEGAYRNEGTADGALAFATSGTMRYTASLAREAAEK